MPDVYRAQIHILESLCVGQGPGGGSLMGANGHFTYPLPLSLSHTTHTHTPLDTAKESMCVMWQKRCQQGDDQGFDKPSHTGLRQYNRNG